MIKPFRRSRTAYRAVRTQQTRKAGNDPAGAGRSFDIL